MARTIFGGESGGTGVNNSGKTITIGGNVSHAGAFAQTFTATGTTTITLPLTGTLSTLSGTETFTNKRITQRIGTTASSATPTPTGDTADQYNITALAANATFAAPTGTPTDGQRIIIRIKDNGTARTLAWNAIYVGQTDIDLPTTTIVGKTIYLQFYYNSADTKWVLLDSNLALTSGLSNKQATLVSGTNIKTLNSYPLLGAGDYLLAPIPTLKNWLLKLQDSPATAKLVFVGDSTSDLAGNASPLISLMTDYSGDGQPLAGFDTTTNMPNYGSNGNTIQNFISGGGLSALVTAAPGLNLIVFSYGINDARTNTVTKSQLKAYVITCIDAIRAASPTTDIILRMPNSFKSVSPNGYIQQGGYASIAAAAQAQSDILYHAYKELEFRWDNVVLLNTQDYAYGRIATATNPLMSDEIHPYYDPMVNLLIEKIGYVEPFRKDLAKTALASNFSNPWTVYPRAMEADGYYTEICTGVINGIGSTYLDITCDAYSVPKLFPTDAVIIGGKFVFQLTGDGGALYPNVLRLTFPSGTLTGNTTTKGTVKIYRSNFNNTEIAQRYFKDIYNYPYRRSVTGYGGVGYIRIETIYDGLHPYTNALRMPAGDLELQESDVIIPEGASTPISLVGASFSKFSDSVLNISLSGDYSSFGGVNWIFGNHLYENV